MFRLISRITRSCQSYPRQTHLRLFHSPTRLKFNQIVDNFLQDLKQDEQENSGGNKNNGKNQVQEKAAMIDLKNSKLFIEMF